MAGLIVWAENGVGQSIGVRGIRGVEWGFEAMDSVGLRGPCTAHGVYAEIIETTNTESIRH